MNSQPSGSRVEVAKMHSGGKDIKGHSKVVSGDDQLALIGGHPQYVPAQRRQHRGTASRDG